METKDFAGLLSKSDQVTTDRAPDVVFDDEELQGLNLEGDDIDHSSRQTGDWTVYLYYFQVMGWRLFTIAVVCSICHIASFTFPRMSHWSLVIKFKN